MSIRSAEAEWQGDLPKGKGRIKTQTGSFDGQYSFSSRFEEGTGTNPEELIAAAHAGCYSMALSNKVDGAMGINLIELVCRAVVPGMDADAFLAQAGNAKVGCPVSRALSAVEIKLDAALEG